MLHRSLVNKRFCYLISFDVEGAFDNVHYRQLLLGLRRMKVDVHTNRIIHNSLRSCAFQEKTAREGWVTVCQVDRGISPEISFLLFCGTPSSLNKSSNNDM